jgi:uncharacterized protein (DUF58 family)
MPRRRRGPRLLAAWPRPTARGAGFFVVAIALFIAAPALGQRSLVFAACLALALPFLALLLVAVRRPKLSVVRRFTPETASVGTDCDVVLSVQNWAATPTPAAAWYDDAARPLRPSEMGALPSLPSFRSLETDAPRVRNLHYVLETPRRGLHSVGPFVIRISDPFGLAVRDIRLGEPNALIVTPGTAVLSRGTFRLPSGDGQSLQTRRPAGAGEQDVIARKYQTGDSMRRVHWPATARHSELMVRQDDQHNDHEAVVVLDSRRASFTAMNERRANVAVSEQFEWAVSMAVSIGLHLFDEGYRTRLVQCGGFPEEADDDGSVMGAAQLLLRGAAISLSDDVAPLELRDIVRDSGKVSGEMPPLFAVLADSDSHDLLALARAASLASSALAFIVLPAAETTTPSWADALRTELQNAGWAVRIASARESQADVWDSLGAERVAS